MSEGLLNLLGKKNSHENFINVICDYTKDTIFLIISSTTIPSTCSLLL